MHSSYSQGNVSGYISERSGVESIAMPLLVVVRASLAGF